MLAATAHRQPHVRDVEAELLARRAAQRQVNSFVSKVDGELLLAAKLQRESMRTDDFRPPGLDYSVIFRPAWFVSGDVYKLSRLDEDHVGLLLADAMGHGVSAAMYSMLIASSATMKEVEGGGYRLVGPDEAMARLNARLVQPESDSIRFASAVAARLNVRTGAMSLCNAGHPTGLVVGADVRPLPSTGPVLGVMDEAEFAALGESVAPGETLVLYTDGLDAALAPPGQSVPEGRVHDFLVGHVRAHTGNPRAITSSIERALDALPGSLTPQDDVTVLVVARHSSAQG
jgi:sigma-B regulation protein RsbU (phosphoserine phosphatase)